MPLSKSRKQEQVRELTQEISDSQTVLFTDFAGSGVQDLEKLRGQLREQGGRYKVIKKTLFVKACQKLDIDLDLEQVPGNLAIVTGEDPVELAKTTQAFAKTTSKDTFAVVGGLLEHSYMNAEQVSALAKLPSKEQLQAQVIGTIAAPMRDFLSVISGPSRGLVTALGEYRDK